MESGDDDLRDLDREFSTEAGNGDEHDQEQVLDAQISGARVSREQYDEDDGIDKSLDDIASLSLAGRSISQFLDDELEGQLGILKMSQSTAEKSRTRAASRGSQRADDHDRISPSSSRIFAQMDAHLAANFSGFSVPSRMTDFGGAIVDSSGVAGAVLGPDFSLSFDVHNSNMHGHGQADDVERSHSRTHSHSRHSPYHESRDFRRISGADDLDTNGSLEYGDNFHGNSIQLPVAQESHVRDDARSHGLRAGSESAEYDLDRDVQFQGYYERDDRPLDREAGVKYDVNLDRLKDDDIQEFSIEARRAALEAASHDYDAGAHDFDLDDPAYDSHSLGFGQSAFDRLDSLIRQEDGSQSESLDARNASVSQTRYEEYGEDAESSRAFDRKSLDLLPSVYDEHRSWAQVDDAPHEEGASNASSPVLRADVEHVKSILDESDLDDLSLPEMSANGSPVRPSPMQQQLRASLSASPNRSANAHYQHPDVSSSMHDWERNEAKRDRQYLDMFDKELEAALPLKYDSAMDQRLANSVFGQSLSGFIGSSGREDRADRSEDRADRQTEVSPAQPNTQDRNVRLSPSKIPRLYPETGRLYPEHASDTAESGFLAGVDVSSLKRNAARPPREPQPPQERARDEGPSAATATTRSMHHVDSAQWRPPSRSSIDIGEPSLLDLPAARTGPDASPLRDLGDETPPSASSVDLRASKAVDENIRASPRSRAAPVRISPLEDREDEPGRRRGLNESNSTLIVGVGGVTRAPTSSSKATVDTLRVLQDQNSRLKSEKAMAKDVIRDLQTELARLRGLVMFERVEPPVKEATLEKDLRRSAQTNEEERIEAIRTAEGLKAERRDNETRAGVGESAPFEKTSQEAGDTNGVLKSATSNANPGPSGPPPPPERKVDDELLRSLQTRSETLEQQLDATRRAAHDVERDRDLVQHRFEETCREVETLRREVVMREIESERARRAAARASKGNATSTFTDDEVSAPVTEEAARPVSRVSYTHVPEVAQPEVLRKSVASSSRSKPRTARSSTSPVRAATLAAPSGEVPTKGSPSRRAQESLPQTASHSQSQPVKDTPPEASAGAPESASFLQREEIESLRREIAAERAEAARLRDLAASREPRKARKSTRAPGEVGESVAITPGTKERLRRLVVTRLLGNNAAETKDSKTTRRKVPSSSAPAWRLVDTHVPHHAGRAGPRPSRGPAPSPTSVPPSAPTSRAGSGKVRATAAPSNPSRQIPTKPASIPKRIVTVGNHKQPSANPRPTPRTLQPAGTQPGIVRGRDMPFLVGTSTTKSHSVTANLQQVFSLLKAHNPSRCSVCQPPTVTTTPRRRPIPTARRREEAIDFDHDDDHASFHGEVLDGAAAVAAASVVGRRRTPAAAGKSEGRGDGVTTLQAVLAVLEDEFDALKQQYHQLVTQYNVTANGTTSPIDDRRENQRPGPTTSGLALRALGDELRQVIRSMETKGDQIHILRDILRSFGVHFGNGTVGPSHLDRHRERERQKERARERTFDTRRSKDERLPSGVRAMPKQ
ncbi:hypothetical protein HKX48_005558 [Thoreauomyces humboldtii]|nr:hypothetical protein HKX48_005558 [Thoreauomyces humboldtii]